MKYVLKRIGMSAATLLLVSIIVFIMFQIVPGDVVTANLGTDITQERAEALRNE